MGGPHFSIYIDFKEDSNSNEILTFLIKELFKDYFVPQSIFFGYEEKGRDFEHDFGINKDSIKRDVLLPGEEDKESIRFTKLSTQNCEKSVLDILSDKTIVYYGFSAYGSLKTYYQKDSDLLVDYFFREIFMEKLDNNHYTPIYLPIIGIDAGNEDTRKYNINRLSEHSLSFDFFYSEVLLDDRYGMDNKIACEKNFEILIEKVKKLADKFQDVYDNTHCSSEGLGYYHKLDTLKDKFKAIPNFEGIHWG